MNNCVCPHCNWSTNVEANLMGQIAECPTCGNDFTIGGNPTPAPQPKTAQAPTLKTRPKTTVRLNRPTTVSETPAAEKRPSRSRRREKEEKPPKSTKAILKTVGWIALVVIVLVFMYFDHANNQLELWKMNDKVIAELEKNSFPLPWFKALTVDSAQYNHYRTLNECTRTNSKKQFNAKYSMDEYGIKLLKNMEYDLSFLRSDYAPKNATVANLAGYWTFYDKKKDCNFYYFFDKNGNFKLIALDSTTSPNEVSPSSVQPNTGSVKIDKNEISFSGSEKETIVALVNDHIVFLAKDGTVGHLRKVHSSVQADLEKIGFK